MKKLLIILTLFIGATSMISPPPADTTASNILKKVTNRYTSFKDMKANFTVSNTNTQTKKTDRINGTLFIKKSKFKLITPGQVIWCDNHKIWTYSEDDEEVTVEKYKRRIGSISPSDIFTIYKKGFIKRLAGTVTIGGVKHYKIELTPLLKKKPYYKAYVYVNKVNYKLKKSEIYYKNGMRVGYDITSFKSNLKLTDDFFKFKKEYKPEAEIVEL